MLLPYLNGLKLTVLVTALAVQPSHGKTDWNQQARKYVTDIHNDRRREEGGCHMNKLIYDMELEHQAKRWAELCEFKHESINGRGENLAAASGTKGEKKLIEEALNNWFNEKRLYGYGQYTCGLACHYTQMVWAKTTKIGCYSRWCDHLSGFRDNAWYLVCFYTPNGNWMGEQPYPRQCTSMCQTGQTVDNDLCVSETTGDKSHAPEHEETGETKWSEQEDAEETNNDNNYKWTHFESRIETKNGKTKHHYFHSSSGDEKSKSKRPNFESNFETKESEHKRPHIQSMFDTNMDKWPNFDSMLETIKDKSKWPNFNSMLETKKGKSRRPDSESSSETEKDKSMQPDSESSSATIKGKSKRPDSESSSESKKEKSKRPDSESSSEFKKGKSKRPDSESSSESKKGKSRRPDSESNSETEKGKSKWPEVESNDYSKNSNSIWPEVETNDESKNTKLKWPEVESNDYSKNRNSKWPEVESNDYSKNRNSKWPEVETTADSRINQNPENDNVCKDNNNLCHEMVAHGQCKYDYMKMHCRKSCDLCPKLCEDLKPGCETYTKYGMCSISVMSIQETCKKSCNMC